VRKELNRGDGTAQPVESPSQACISLLQVCGVCFVLSSKKGVVMAFQSSDYFQSLTSVVSAYASTIEVRDLVVSLSNLLLLALQYDQQGDTDFVQGMREGIEAVSDYADEVWTLSELLADVSKGISYQEWQYQRRVCQGLYCDFDLSPYAWHIGFTFTYVTLVIASGRTPLQVPASLHPWVSPFPSLPFPSQERA
jgi:hypothetical protein